MPLTGDFGPLRSLISRLHDVDRLPAQVAEDAAQDVRALLNQQPPPAAPPPRAAPRRYHVSPEVEARIAAGTSVEAAGDQIRIIVSGDPHMRPLAPGDAALDAAVSARAARTLASFFGK